MKYAVTYDNNNYSHTTAVVNYNNRSTSVSIRLQPLKYTFVVLHCCGSARGGAQLQLANLLPCGIAAGHAVHNPIPYQFQTEKGLAFIEWQQIGPICDRI